MTPVDNLEERLAPMNDAFNDAPTEGGYGGPKPPDGTYQAIVKEFDFFESNDGDRLYLKTVLTIALDAEWEGMDVECVHSIDDPDRIQYVKTHLHRLGLNLDDFAFSTLQAHLHELLDVPVEIAIKRSKKTDDEGNPYVNVYCNERLGNPLPRGPQTDVPADTDGLPPVNRDEEIGF